MGNYYMAGDNYGRGGHYGAGDIFGIGKALKKFQPLKLVGSLLGSTPIGRVATSLVPGIGGGRQIVAPIGAQIPRPGIGGALERILPGGATGYYTRRRLNPMNVKALRRASRRIDGFAKTARSALKHTPFQIVRRGSGGRGSSPGVITRAEALKALKR